jgi:putative ABC transport system ATP-binding protein
MTAPLVKLEGVEKVYGIKEASLTVLKQVDLSIGEGEFVGIVGASGSGKTTLMNILGCLDRPTRGRYLLNDQDVSRLNDDRLSAIRNLKIGFVFQSFNLIPELTVLENVEVPLFYKKTPRRKRRSKCIELLEAVGLSKRLKHHPSQLSGGECQRVAIARALVNDPAIVLADEPTGNLDSQSGKEILKLFHELHRAGRTLVVVTHNPEISTGLPRAVEFRDGRILKDHKKDSQIQQGEV